MLTFSQKPLSRIANIFSPTSPQDFIGFVGIGIIINLLSGGDKIGLIGVVFLWLFWVWREKVLYQRFKISLTTKQAPKGARGIILLLSPYSPRDRNLKNQEVINLLIDKILNTPIYDLEIGDFAAIDLFNSNLVPQIKAIEYHFQASRLDDIWLITTKSHNTKNGSQISAKILQKYLHFHYQQQGKKLFKVHTQGLQVEDWNYVQLRSVSDKIFQNSDYRDSSIVADITGGTKIMSMALAMSCTQPGRRLQYMDSQRDWQGNPLKNGDIQPIGIDVTRL